MGVPINREVHDGIEHVRATRYNESPHTHMLDVERVQALARHDGFETTASWIEDHEQAYAEVLFGFEISEDSLSPTACLRKPVVSASETAALAPA